MTFYHYTCDHGREDIGDQGELLSLALLRPKALLSAGEDWVLRRQLIWVTDLAEPDIEGLGLTSETLTCERWRHRYRITNERPIQRFSDMQHRFSAYVQASLLAGNARPEHWFVSWVPLPVVYEPIEVPA